MDVQKLHYSTVLVLTQLHLADANEVVVPHLAKTFATVSGLSDHTLENTAAITSIALGGSIIENI